MSGFTSIMSGFSTVYPVGFLSYKNRVYCANIPFRLKLRYLHSARISGLKPDMAHECYFGYTSVTIATRVLPLLLSGYPRVDRNPAKEPIWTRCYGSSEDS